MNNSPRLGPPFPSFFSSTPTGRLDFSITVFQLHQIDFCCWPHHFPRLFSRTSSLLTPSHTNDSLLFIDYFVILFGYIQRTDDISTCCFCSKCCTYPCAVLPRFIRRLGLRQSPRFEVLASNPWPLPDGLSSCLRWCVALPQAAGCKASESLSSMGTVLVQCQSGFGVWR